MSDETNETDGETADGTTNIQIAFPLDRGFLRQECPSCEREFKRLGDHVTATDSEATLFCPYCYEPAQATMWWTKAQVKHMHEVTYERAVAPKLREFERSLGSIRTGGLFDISFKMQGVERPAPLPTQESADMTRVEFVCHPDEPLRIADDWEFDVACALCRARYSFSDVKRADPPA